MPLVVAANLFAITVARADEPVLQDPAGPGCDSSRPAVAHQAGGAPLDAQPEGAPLPCMTFTGRPTDTAQIGRAPGMLLPM